MSLEFGQVTKVEIVYIMERILELDFRKWRALVGLIGGRDYEILQTAYYQESDITPAIHNAADSAIGLFFCRAMMVV